MLRPTSRPDLRTRRLPALAGALALAVVLLGACTESAVDSEPEVVGEDGGQDRTYVAIGDSYTAAPRVGETTDEACRRTDANYPTLVAEELDLDLIDVSCAGAETQHLVEQQHPQGAPVAPQLDAVDASTDIVTFSLGGNDEEYYARIVGCGLLGADDPDGAPCSERFGLAGAGGAATERALVERAVATLTDNVATGIGAVAERAPQARILVVGYPQFAPEGDSCEQFPVAEGDRELVGRLNEALVGAVRSAAEQEDVEYVDLAALTAGHDVCSDDPWVAGADPTEPAAAFHPYAEEQEAAADAIVALLEQDGDAAAR